MCACIKELFFSDMRSSNYFYGVYDIIMNSACIVREGGIVSEERDYAGINISSATV